MYQTAGWMAQELIDLFHGKKLIIATSTYLGLIRVVARLLKLITNFNWTHVCTTLIHFLMGIIHNFTITILSSSFCTNEWKLLARKWIIWMNWMILNERQSDLVCIEQYFCGICHLQRFKEIFRLVVFILSEIKANHKLGFCYGLGDR